MNELDIFSAALDLADPAARARYLNDACGESSELRTRIEALLRNTAEASQFLESPVGALPEAATGTVVDHTSGDPPSTLQPRLDRTEISLDAVDLNLDFLTPSDDPAALGRIGQYTVTHVIGRGGMGVVLKARDPSLNRVVAVKVLASELAGNPTARKRFLREARAAAAVVHQHIVTIHAVAEEHPPYLVMECVDGQSLQDKIDATGPLELKETLRIAVQVASGLAAAHAHGVIHRDIKPSNILLENGVERVRITDFGLARAVDDVEITRTGEVAGTPQYMSPEQAQGQPVDTRSDLFSFGCVLYAMCTGRPPFRAESTIAAIRRVCDESPRPIREVNAETPDWLSEIIDRLLAKRLEERFQTAQDVADLLGQHLAHVQDPATSPQPAGLPSPPQGEGLGVRGQARQRWVAAALILMAVLATLGTTEATGVTHLAGTVVRIVTGEGTLIIEIDDPTVRVSLDGEELTISGGGVQEVRLRPGQYQFVARKDGQPVKQELVTITRGGEKVVTVSREAVERTTAGPASTAEPGAFVVLRGEGVPERKYDTLAEAVLAASEGDTIEVRGNGPFLTKPLVIAGTPLIIRAGRGFEPVIQLEKDELKAGLPLLKTDAALTLEGVELRREFEGLPVFPERTLLLSSGAPLNLSHCRVVTGDYVWAVQNTESSRLEARDCLFAGGSLYWAPSVGGRLLVHNCLIACRFDGVIVHQSQDAAGSATVHFTRNTVYAAGPFRLINARPDEGLETKPGSPTMCEATENVFDGTSLMAIATTRIADLDTALAAFPDWLSWRDSRNLYSIRGEYLDVWPDPLESEEQILPAVQGLSEWLAVWEARETGSIEGELRYRSLRLMNHDLEPPVELREADFRLLPGSAGYQAGPDGKDLGADVDLVGPGAAYERWKKTPDYQVWLKETGQFKPTPEKQAFVVLNAKGTEVRKHDTLADAVLGVSDGDTIEVRGNGPFITEAINITAALTIRAADSFRPVIKQSVNSIKAHGSLLAAEAPLILEGLEFQRTPPDRKEGEPWQNLLWTTSALHAVNCRFVTYKTEACIQTTGAVCKVQNSEFLCGDSYTVYLTSQWPEPTFVLENCLLTESPRIGCSGVTKSASIQLTHNTFRTRMAPFWFSWEEAQGVDDAGRRDKVLQIDASGNIFDAGSVFHFGLGRDLPAADAEALLARLVGWKGKQNLFPKSGSFVTLHFQDFIEPSQPIKDLTDWRRFWGTTESDSIEARVRYQGGDLLGRLANAPEQLTPEDFRLRPDSAGYQAGPDGKDLGADIDLVGPGAAYERWKQTPEYQQWLKETGQKK